jgi:hypothetical protein
LLKNTKHDDLFSLSQLSWEINNPAGIARLPLGNYIAGSVKVFCCLHFTDPLLPRDPPSNGPSGESDLTYLKCIPKNDALPKLVHQIGQLCLSSTTNDVARAKPSCFVVVVTSARKVFAIWNPIGPDPECTYDNDELSTAWKIRPTSGKFMCFRTPCTAVMLADNIDALCQPNQREQNLAISETKFITLPVGSTLRFTGKATA